MTISRIHRAAIISFILLCVCAQSTAAVDEESLASAYRLQDFAIDPFEEPIGNSFSLADAKAKIIERFGEPIEQELSKYPDRTSDEIFTRFIFQYDGITFRVGENEAGNRSWIGRIEVTENTHALKYGLHIGSTRSEVISLFQPAEYRIDKNPMRLYTNIVQDPPNMAVWEGPVIVVVISFDSEDRVTGITVSPSGL